MPPSFPIAEMSVDVLLILAVGAGLLTAPLLFSVGGPVAVGAEAAPIAAAGARLGMKRRRRLAFTASGVALGLPRDPTAAPDDVYPPAPAGVGTPISRMHTGLPPDPL